MNLEHYRYPSLIQTMHSMIFIACLNYKTWGLPELARVCKLRHFEMLPESITKECIKECIKLGWCEKDGKTWKSSL